MMKVIVERKVLSRIISKIIGRKREIQSINDKSEYRRKKVIREEGIVRQKIED